jgi:hypothetical protein
MKIENSIFNKLLKLCIIFSSYFILDTSRRCKFQTKYFLSIDKYGFYNIIKFIIVILSYFIINKERRASFRNKYFFLINSAFFYDAEDFCEKSDVVVDSRSLISDSIDFTLPYGSDTVWKDTKVRIYRQHIRQATDALAKGKKLVIYGNNTLAEDFKEQLNIGIFCCVDDKAESFCCGKPVINIYDLAYAEPKSFFVIAIQPYLPGSKIFNTFTSLGLLYNFDYFILVCALPHEPVCIDTLLGHSRFYNEYNNEFPGFKIYGNLDDKRSMRLVALGGSTTDPTLENIMSWPEYLYYICLKSNINIVIYNGGIVNYKSSVELIKLIRDAVQLRPDIIVSYSGINDLAHEVSQKSPNISHLYKKHFVFKVHDDRFRNTLGVGQPIINGLETTQNGAEFWVNNQKMMYAICTEFNIKFFGILQSSPYSEDDPSIYCSERYRSFIDLNNAFLRQGYNNYSHAKSFYDEAEAKSVDVPYILTFRRIFDKIRDYDVYYDNSHTYERGNQVIAANIFESLKNRGWLSVF